MVLFDELIADYEKQAEAKKNYRNERYYIGATVDREMACLRAMLNKAVKWELIPKNPASPEWKVWQKAVTNLEGAEKANSSIEAQSIGIAGA